MDPIFLTPVAVVIVSLVVMVIMKKRHRAAMAEVNIDQERGNYDTYKNELLNRDFSFLKTWMDGKAIDAFS